MKDVQVVSFLFGIDRSGQRVDDRFANPVADRKDKGGPKQNVVHGIFTGRVKHRRRRKQHDGRNQVADHRHDQQLFVADEVDQ